MTRQKFRENQTNVSELLLYSNLKSNFMKCYIKLNWLTSKKGAN